MKNILLFSVNHMCPNQVTLPGKVGDCFFLKEINTYLICIKISKVDKTLSVYTTKEGLVLIVPTSHGADT